MKKRCIGFPVGTPCENEAGSKWGPNWCHDCDVKRIAHIDGCFAELTKPPPACKPSEEEVK